MQDGKIKFDSRTIELITTVLPAIVTERAEPWEKLTQDMKNDRVLYMRAADIVDCVVDICGLLGVQDPFAVVVGGKPIREAWNDSLDRSVLKCLSRPGMPLAAFTWFNAEKYVRHVEGKQSLRVSKSHAWRMADGNKSLLVEEEHRPAVRRALGLLEVEWDGVIPFPWEGKEVMDEIPRSVDFVVMEDPANADALMVAIIPWASGNQLLMTIDSFGNSVVLDVQRKLPVMLRDAKVLYRLGPNLAIHHSGPNSFESSGVITLPRPLARDGTHSYLTPRAVLGDMGPIALPRHFEEELRLDDLRDRNDLVEDDVAQGCLYVRLHLEKQRKADTELAQKRARAFASSPPRRRPVD